MLDASPNVMLEPFVDAERLEPTLRLMAPEEPLILLTYAVGAAPTDATIALPADV
jgi:hypothetical protein